MSEIEELAAGGAQVPAVEPAAIAVKRVATGVHWLWAITAFSALSLSANASGLGRHAFVGLGAPIVAAVLTEGADVAPALLSGLASVALILMFGFMAWATGRGKRWAFAAAGVVYLLDAALLALLGDWASVAFHAVAVWFVVRGWSAMSTTGPIVTPLRGVGPLSATLSADREGTEVISGARLLKVALIAVGGFVAIIALTLLAGYVSVM